MTSASANLEEFRVDVAGQKTVTAIQKLPASSDPDWLFVYAPGAASNINDPFGARLSRGLAAEGIATVRFQFPYMEERRRGPDRPQVLEATWRSVIDAVQGKAGRLAIGGRSMGGRIASHVAAQGTDIHALVLFAYPLRPPNNPSRVRDDHFPSIGVPTLFCSGTRDSFGTPAELADAATTVPKSKLHLLDGADHSFAVPKSIGRTREDVWDEAIGELLHWLYSL